MLQALLALLIQNPFAAASVSLQMSFGAVAGILPFKGDVRYDGRSIIRLSRLEIAKKAAFLTQMSEVYFPYRKSKAACRSFSGK